MKGKEVMVESVFESSGGKFVRFKPILSLRALMSDPQLGNSSCFGTYCLALGRPGE